MWLACPPMKRLVFQMKIRRLLEVDIARYATLSADEQRLRMRKQVGGGGGLFSFKPTRDQFADILNSQPPIFVPLGASPVTELPIIEEAIRKSSRSPEE